MIDERPEQILWEFTLDCNKNCFYCGSKDILNTKSQIDLSFVADKIIEVNPHSVTITGGQPATHYDQLYQCVVKLHMKDIKVKVLTNGHLFQKISHDTSQDQLLIDYLTAVGYSVNTLEDIKQFSKYYQYIPEELKQKITIVTNFGTHNLCYFSQLAKFAVQFNCWQVQLTIGNEYQLDLNEIRQLQQLLQTVQSSRLVQVVRADNFNCTKCQAGIKGFSITHDGLVIPCLSYRTWKRDLHQQGFVSDLKYIWKYKFQFNRTREFVPSCKTISGIQKLYEKVFKQQYEPFEYCRDEKQQQLPYNMVFVYGVATPPNKTNITSISTNKEDK